MSFERRLRTHAEARSAAFEAASVCPQRWQVAEALMELLANAIEHGSLGIGHEMKARCRAAGTWEAELARRSEQPDLGRRMVLLRRVKTYDGWRFEVRDEGAGFDWRGWRGFDSARQSAPCGRGIALVEQWLPGCLSYEEAGRVACLELARNPGSA